MHLLPRAPERVRPLPVGPRDSGQKWATILAAARHRRAPHMWPAPPHPTTGDLVRVYVLPEDERTRALASLPEATR
jgi:hypothetical protein